MTPSRRNLLVSGLVAAGALGAGAFVAVNLYRSRDEILGKARFVDLHGNPRALTEWLGKVVVANFWATWCAPCLEEIPLLMATRRKLAAKSIEIVGIAIDQVDKVKAFAAKLQIDYPVLVADAGALDLVRSLGNQSAGLPFTVFVDRAGRPARTKLGLLRQPELDSILAGLTGS